MYIVTLVVKRKVGKTSKSLKILWKWLWFCLYSFFHSFPIISTFLILARYGWQDLALLTLIMFKHEWRWVYLFLTSSFCWSLLFSSNILFSGEYLEVIELTIILRVSKNLFIHPLFFQFEFELNYEFNTSKGLC